ncbi:MAG TPA: hypothetical protein VKU41_13190, partial [Polyangiaceae bacterium]|nr:hypothetical protein [Polyangiaceae bacterium]
MIGALAMSLAAPPHDVWPVGLVAWVPLAVVATSGTVLRTALVGWLQGTTAQAAVLASLPSAVHVGAGTPMPAALGLAAVVVLIEGGRSGAIGLLAALGTRNGWPTCIAFPLSLAAAESFYPMLFPWSTWLLFQGAPVLLQGAEFGGAPAISLWAGFLDAALATAWRGREERRAVVIYGVLAPIATLGIVVVGGALRMHTTEALEDAARGLR